VATNATVKLGRDGRVASLEIADDGSGFNPRQDSSGNGLRNMRERVAAIGGLLRITTRKGKGTSIRFTFPVAQDGAVRTGRARTTGRAVSQRAVRR
jgi:signal transduction histidine kinase